MTQLVTATYPDPSVAKSAIASLKTYGFIDDDLILLAAADDLKAALYKAGLSHAAAAKTAASLGSAGVLVGVRTPFGHATKVARTLQSYQGGQIMVQPLADHELDTIPAAPFSKIFNWPTLFADATPFSNFWRFPALADFGTLSGKFGWGQLSGEAAPLSKMMNLKTLTDGPLWLSQKLGPLLLSKQAEWWR